MTGHTILCFGCHTLPAGNDLAGVHSAYCRFCQPWPSASAQPSAQPAAKMTADEAMAVLAQFIPAK